MITATFGRGHHTRVVLVALSMIYFVAGCSQTPEPPEVVRPVKSLVLTPGGETHVRTFPGKVEASKRVELAFQVSGLLVKLPIQEGQKVAKGDVIAQLREDEFEARLKALQGQLDQARATMKKLQAGERPEEKLRREAQVRAARAKLANARSEYDIARQLKPRGSIATKEYDRAATNVRVAEQEYKAAVQILEKGSMAREEDILAQEATIRGLEGRVVEAKIQLDDCTLRAPYDGVIAKRFVELKQNIRATEPVVKFQDVEEIDIAMDVPEAVMATDVRRADIVELVADFTAAPGLRFPVHITEVAQRADPVTQTFLVRVAMKAPPDLNLLPGMTATVAMTYRPAQILGNRLRVPIAAVSKDARGEQVVWVIGSDDTVARRPVKLGVATGGEIEIVSGLQPGERIAVAGVTFLREGMKVRDLGDALGGN
jgi:RND family efflux transporter MFP subunit